MVNLLSISIAIAVPYALIAQPLAALDLKGTVYETAGRYYQIDPLLLYSISIAESGKSARGFVKPTPLVIRTPEGPLFFNDLPQAVGVLREQRARFESIDVGLMQINIKYHPKADPMRLFDANYAVHYAASYLRTCLDSTTDPIEGVGRYHNWERDRSRWYGERVWGIYSRIKNTTHLQQ